MRELKLFFCSAMLCAMSVLMLLGATALADEGVKRFCLGLGIGGIGDRSFNDMLVLGTKIVRNKHGIPFSLGVPNSTEDIETVLGEFVEEGCPLVFAGSWEYRTSVDSLARKNPDVRFVMIDAEPIRFLDNVSSVTFRQNEGSFLAGALAALMTRTGVLGFLGGENHPVINDFLVGFKAGAHYINPNANISVGYIADEFSRRSPWASPEAAEKIAGEMHLKNQCDIIFAAAAGSNAGVFKAAARDGFYSIGVDSDQDFFAPGSVLTSVMKRMDTAIEFAVGQYLKGTLTNTNYSLGLFEHGVGLSPMTYTKQLIGRKNLGTINRLEFDIVQGAIRVPSFLSGVGTLD